MPLEIAVPSLVAKSTLTVSLDAADSVTAKVALLVPLLPSVTVLSLMEMVGIPNAPLQTENSEVSFLLRSVAVAVTNSPTPVGALKLEVKLMMPVAGVITTDDPRKRSPSPWLEASHDELAKNSMRYCVLAWLFSDPLM